MTNRPTRRDLLIATGTAGAAALAGGCGDSGDGDSSTSVSPGRSGGTPGQELTTTDDVPVAGGFATAPSVILNLLPWHGQLIVPSETVETRHC